MEDGRQPQSLLDRPVRSLLDLKIGTVLKGYLLYVALGLVIGLVGLAVVLSMRGSGDEGGGLAGQGFTWVDGTGDAVTPAQYRAVPPRAQLETVRRRFGEPATTRPKPFDQVSGSAQTCLGYRSSASDSTLFEFCFEGGRLVEKRTL